MPRKKLTDIQQAFDLETTEKTTPAGTVAPDENASGEKVEETASDRSTRPEVDSPGPDPVDLSGRVEGDRPLEMLRSGETEKVSLVARLQMPKKKPEKIRFTLDLEKPLDDRLNRAAHKLHRSKADLARIALERLLEELEAEWKS